MKIDPEKLEYQECHHLIMQAFIPRPIALISTLGEDGVLNVTPFSCFTIVSNRPACFGVSIGSRRNGERKDTIRNIEFAQEFVAGIVTETMAKAMNKASADFPSHVDEFKESGLTPLKASGVKASLIAESPVNLECKLWQNLEVGEEDRRVNFVLGRILQIHINDDLIGPNDEVDFSGLKFLGRLGGDSYCRVTDTFTMARPSGDSI